MFRWEATSGGIARGVAESSLDRRPSVRRNPLNNPRAKLRRLTLAFVVVGLGTGPAAAQLRPVVIKNARIVNPGGSTIEQACIKVAGGKIEAVQPVIKTGLLTKTIDATGKTVTPGLIDCWSSLGLIPVALNAPITCPS